MPRSALIVDDSRTALMALGRLLKGQGIATDMVESGPEALDYLRSNTPGVIFLDHMMPGMDGFETLAAFKANGRTASIPVVMYTSREGDAYMGQALVLGAFGVLQKPVDSADLELILQRVDRLRAPQAAASAVRVASASGARAPARPSAAVTGVIHVPPEFRTRTAVAPIRSVSRSESQPRASATEARKTIPALPWSVYLKRALWVVLLLLPAVWYFERYQQAERMQQEVQRENQELRAQQEAARLAAAEENALQHTAVDVQRRGESENHTLLDALSWALNQHAQYGLQEEPLSDARLAQVRELAARLAAAGFQGTIRLETHVGEFCLIRDERGDYRMPSDSLPIGRCEIVTHPPAQAVVSGQRQSAAFARYLAERRPSNRIQIAVVSHGTNRPLVSYPDSASMQTAGDWNQIARLNQRVEVVLLPAP